MFNLKRQLQIYWYLLSRLKRSFLEKLYRFFSYAGNLLGFDEHMQGTLKLILMSTIIGGVVALGAIFFEHAVDLTKHFILDGLAGYNSYGLPGETSFQPYILAILPAIGGLLGGFLVYFCAPEAQGPGTGAVIESYHHWAGRTRPRVAFVKIIASTLTLGFGGSAGKEGPMGQIGASLAFTVGRFFALDSKQIKILTLVGLAAGIGAMFRAPLAGALFASEVLYRDMDFEKDVIVPSIISSIIAYGIFGSTFGWTPLFATPEMDFQNPWELIPYTAVAIAVVIGARCFTFVFQRIQIFFNSLQLAPYYKPAVGGLIAGVIGTLVHPHTLADGYTTIQNALNGEASFRILLLIAFGKIITTSFTVASGNSGGTFAPSIVIGGCIGGAVGIFAQKLTSYHLPVTAFVVVGMAGFFSCAAKTPISTIIMVSEISGSYQLLVPTMWVCVLAYILGGEKSIYREQLPTRYDSPSQFGHMMSEMLTRMKVKDIYEKKCDHHFVTIQENQHVDDVITAFVNSHHQVDYPIIGVNGDFLGIIDQDEVRKLLVEKEIQHMLIASDLLLRTPILELEDNLQTAIRKMISCGHDELFVIQNKKLIGILSRRRIIDYYDRKMKLEEGDTILENRPAEKKDLVVSGLFYRTNCSSKVELFQFLVEHVPLYNKEHKRDLILHLLQREGIESTAIGDGIAFPHPRERILYGQYASIAIVVLEEPISFGAMDGQPVDIVCLILCNDAITHLNAMKKLSQAFVQRDLATKLRAYASKEEILESLQLPEAPCFRFLGEMP